ncbi:MAG: c-type cytochrome [Verrucomicrobiae bacterium]|nr:c-type cytochrome [Verrucomicrobiae bacterium]
MFPVVSQGRILALAAIAISLALGPISARLLGADETSSGSSDAYRRMVLMKGAWLFDRNCAFCHEKDGRGAVGPNLTDWYFIHGATRDDMHRVVQEGVPEKGMPTWKAILKPTDLRLIEHYVWSLRGKEVKGKEPQGEKCEPDVES